MHPCFQSPVSGPRLCFRSLFPTLEGAATTHSQGRAFSREDFQIEPFGLYRLRVAIGIEHHPPACGSASWPSRFRIASILVANLCDAEELLCEGLALAGVVYQRHCRLRFVRHSAPRLRGRGPHNRLSTSKPFLVAEIDWRDGPSPAPFRLARSLLRGWNWACGVKPFRVYSRAVSLSERMDSAVRPEWSLPCSLVPRLSL